MWEFIVDIAFNALGIIAILIVVYLFALMIIAELSRN